LNQNQRAKRQPNVRVTSERALRQQVGAIVASYAAAPLFSLPLSYLGAVSLFYPEAPQKACQERESGSRGCSAQKPIFEFLYIIRINRRNTEAFLTFKLGFSYLFSFQRRR
jgi:hypothetical protein